MPWRPFNMIRHPAGFPPFDGHDVLVWAEGCIYQALWKTGRRNGKKHEGFMRRPAELQGKWIDKVTKWMPIPNEEAGLIGPYMDMYGIYEVNLRKGIIQGMLLDAEWSFCSNSVSGLQASFEDAVETHCALLREMENEGYL